MPLALPLLRDPVRAVRIEAARVLAGVPRKALSRKQRVFFDAALSEYRAAQRANAERPESHLNLALLHMDRGETQSALTYAREWQRLAPRDPNAMRLVEELSASGNASGDVVEY